jgi:phospholipase C
MRHAPLLSFTSAFLFGLLICVGCSSSSSQSSDAGPDARDAASRDAHEGDAAPSEGGTGDGGEVCPKQSPKADPPSASNVKHVVIVVQENHSFDNYFAYYCTAATGSMPTCNTGPACCEAPPGKQSDNGDGGLVGPATQDDIANGNFDPNHTQACELVEIDDGKMDKYVTAPEQMGGPCGSPSNFAYANQTTIQTYWTLAGSNALADTYFQSIAGQSSSNDMYLATANYVFTDDAYEPKAIGASCQAILTPVTKSFTGTTIADLLIKQDVSWGWFGEGYDAMLAAQKTHMCPKDPKCTAGSGITFYPCTYDPGDDPFAYYPQLADDPKYMFDYTELACDAAAGALPAVSYVKAIGYKSEHPGLGDTISNGEAFVTDVIDTIEKSKYAKDTLILVTWDESGGFFDHVPPPPTSTIDHQPYGPRIPMLAIGTFAKKNYISHVQMEHASIVKFIEWNWLDKKTGQLDHRDTVVNNIGDMLDPAETGVTVPAN